MEFLKTTHRLIRAQRTRPLRKTSEASLSSATNWWACSWALIHLSKVAPWGRRS